MSPDLEYKLYRVINGRLSFRRGGLNLVIKEPDQSLQLESFEIYHSAYQEAYEKGILIKEESDEIAYEMGMLYPTLDRDIEEVSKAIDDLKVAAYKSFYNKKQLYYIKMNIRNKEMEQAKLLNIKSQLDKYTCESIAAFSRWNWIIEKSTYYMDTNMLYDWKHINISTIINFYEENMISSSEFRNIARDDPWRSMWLVGKKTGDLFGKPACNLTRDQLILSSYSSMYDSVYESSESPDSKIIEDDDCLDGWFVEQKRKNEKIKNENLVNQKISNSKISNSGEVFVVASSKEEASMINNINSDHIKNIKAQRMNKILSSESMVKDTDFDDVKQDLRMRNVREGADRMRGK